MTDLEQKALLTPTTALTEFSLESSGAIYTNELNERYGMWSWELTTSTLVWFHPIK